MVSLEKRLVPWLGFVGDLLGEPLDHLPHEAVFHQLLASFPATGASFNWSQPGGQLGVITHPRSFLEHVYRKLRVRDRVNAVRTARLWGPC